MRRRQPDAADDRARRRGDGVASRFGRCGAFRPRSGGASSLTRRLDDHLADSVGQPVTAADGTANGSPDDTADECADGEPDGCTLADAERMPASDADAVPASHANAVPASDRNV